MEVARSSGPGVLALRAIFAGASDSRGKEAYRVSDSGLNESHLVVGARGWSLRTR